MITLLTYVLLTGAVETCGEFSRSTPQFQEAFLEGMGEGQSAGKFLYYRAILEHEVAGENSDNVARALHAISSATYKAQRIEDVTKAVRQFCKIDKRGQLQLYLVYLSVVRHLSGGSDEEFARDVRILNKVTYGKEGERI